MNIGDALGNPWSGSDIRVVDDEELLARSSGQISKPETLNYRTLKPEPDGLFDADVFGALEEMHRVRDAGMNVPWANNDVTSRFGHIELAAPIVHPFYATYGLSVLADALGMSLPETRQLVFQELVIVDGALRALNEVPTNDAVYGAEALAAVSPDSARFLVRNVLVAPIATRPIVHSGEGRWVTSHVNDLYRRVVNRNNRLKRLLELDAPVIININELRMLQEATCQLFFNGFEGLKVLTGPDRERLVSLLELSRTGADLVAAVKDGSGPAYGVRALRVLEAMGFGLGRERPAEPRTKPAVVLSLSGSPVPVPGVTGD